MAGTLERLEEKLAYLERHVAEQDKAMLEMSRDLAQSGQKRLKMAPAKHKMPNVRLKRAPRYTPVSKRQDKPDAVYWLIKNHPEFTDSEIIKLIGTTKATIGTDCDSARFDLVRVDRVGLNLGGVDRDA